MKLQRIISIVLFGSLLAAVSGRTAADSPPLEVKTLEGLVNTWVDLRSQLAAEKQAWSEKQEQWRQELALLEKEKSALQATLADVDNKTTQAESKRADLLARKEGLDKTLADLGPVLDRAERDVRRCVQQVPPSLRAEIESSLSEIPTTQAAAGQADLARRLQVVVAIYSRLEVLQHQVHITRELLPMASGKRREVEILYLGLARGFALSPDKTWAAIGVPGDAEWSWLPRPELAAEIHKAIQVFQRQAPAAFVSLPLAAKPVAYPAPSEASAEPAGGGVSP